MYYIRYPLSLSQVEDMLHERGIDICHETVRYWWQQLGSVVARKLKRKCRHASSPWRRHMDEVFVKIKGEAHYLWRAVDQEGTEIDCYVSKRRNKQSALKFLRKAIKNHGHPRQIVTDKLKSYSAALKNLDLMHIQETRRYQNNQVENSHLHFRRREKMMNRFRSMRSLEQFASIQSQFQNHFNHQRHITRPHFKELRQQSLDSWNAIFAA